MPTYYCFEPFNGPVFVSYLGGYLHTEVYVISHWIVPGTLNLED